MPRLTVEEKVAIASDFVLQSPPGEVNDVLNDLRIAVENDAALEEGIHPALEEYNNAQLTSVDIPGEQYKIMLSSAGRLQTSNGTRYLDPRGGKTYVVDQMSLSISDPEPYEHHDEELETYRKSLERAADSYLASHHSHKGKPGSGDAPVFGDSSISVFSPLGDPSTLSTKVWTVQLVSNKYKPSNYWSGRWRSTYEVEPGKLEIRGRIAVDVHYYEGGNVQLHTLHTPQISLPSATARGDQIVALIADEESKYHAKLVESFEKMREGGFKGLRRVLPVTREKIDWDRTLGYKLREELAGTRT